MIRIKKFSSLIELRSIHTESVLMESFSEGPEVGDYVFIVVDKFHITSRNSFNDEYLEFLRTHIGRVYKIDFDGDYRIEFDEPFRGTENDIGLFNLRDIGYWSSSKENVEIWVNAKKYNL